MSTIALEFFAVLAFLFIHGIFVAVEYSIVRCEPGKLKGSDITSKWGTQSALTLLDRLRVSLEATQFGSAVFSVFYAVSASNVIFPALVSFFAWVGFSEPPVIPDILSFAIGLLLIILLYVSIGLFLPKEIAVRFPEDTLRLVSAPVLLLSKALSPLSSFTSKLIRCLFGFPSSRDENSVELSGELTLLISKSSDSTDFNQEEKDMLRGIVDFSNKVAREVMTARTDMVVIPAKASYSEIVHLVASSGLSRFPVVHDDMDDVAGILLARDLIPYLEKTSHDKDKFNISKILRPPFFVPGTKPINEILNEFKSRKIHLAIVLDEHGGIDGIVTLEDLLEEIVGAIFDESDIPETDIFMDSNGEFVIDGGVLIDDINEKCKCSLPDGDYDTIGGFIFATLGRIPVQGEVIQLNKAGIPISNEQLLEMSETGQINSDVEENENSIVEALLQPAIVLSIENVAGNRIETIRLRKFTTQAEE